MAVARPAGSRDGPAGSPAFAASAATVEAALAFTPLRDVDPDPERPGLLRARTRALDAPPEAFDRRTCRLHDWGEDASFRPDLVRHGFDCIDLSAVPGLTEVLERVRDAGHAREQDARAIRRRLAGQTVRLGDGSRLRLLAIAAEGFIMRVAGPNGLALHPPDAMTAMNGHDAARAVHADQDVRGTPLRQIMRGAAPWLFHHDAPDSRNGWSPLWLINLWLPLQQITRPLVLMDTGSLDRSAHQLRYGLPTEGFLERDEDRRVNDIWTFLHDEGQRWWFRAELPLGSAYVFETLGTPHGSCILPGEDEAERRYRRLAAAIEAVGGGDEEALRRAIAEDGPSAGPVATRPLGAAIDAMEERLAEARRDAAALCRGTGAGRWQEGARRAMDAVVRKSLEMRVVALRWPARRRA